MQLLEHCTCDNPWEKIDVMADWTGGPAEVYIHGASGHNEGAAVAAGGHIRR